MPRGSKPGERRGGRQRGTPNKKTALRNAALAAAAANPEILPLEFLLGIMRDPNVSSELRINVAQATLPFVHAKPGSARSGDPAGTAKLIDGTGAFTIDNAVAKALRDDYHRLGELERKKCGDPLSAAEVRKWLRALDAGAGHSASAARPPRFAFWVGAQRRMHLITLAHVQYPARASQSRGPDHGARNPFRLRADFRRRAGVRQILPKRMAN